jgi:2-oxoglutarate dehydrogenase E1 component
MVEDYRSALEEGRHVAKALVRQPNTELFVDWRPYLGHQVVDDWNTGLPAEQVCTELGMKQLQYPEGFVLQKQVQKVMDDRAKMYQGELT